MACPFAGAAAASSTATASATAPARCPLGYDSDSFKLGPLSCVICRALIFTAARCLPCRHVYCRACISRFKDCPICGSDIADLEDDRELQQLVDQFIQGHARIKRQAQEQEPDQVAYEDASLARGAFLLQHAIRAFRAHNLESAKARLELCLEDARGMTMSRDAQNQVHSQLGAILGLLGDCLRSMGDLHGAMDRYTESVEALEKIENKDAEIIHALSVSLNKLGDVKYYAEDLPSAQALYKRALELRQNAMTAHSQTYLSTENIDLAISLAKVADVERGLGNKAAAIAGFSQAINLLEGLSLPLDQSTQLVMRCSSILDFLRAQIGDT